VLVAPSANEVSFGRIAGRVARGTSVVVVSIDRRVAAKRDLRGGRRTFDFHVALPPRDVRVTVIAVTASGRRSATTVAPVFGLPLSARPRAPPRGQGDARLGRTVRGLARGFSGLCGIFVGDVRTGRRAMWNARAEFPAASTLKVAIAIEVLRALRGKPPPGSTVDRLLRKMLVPSDDKAANALLVWLGGSTSGGSARVNALLGALGLYDSDMYGGYEVQGAGPSFVGKRTTAWDFGRLLLYLDLAAEGRGRLAERFRGSFVPADARFLLYLLAHATPNWLAGDLPRGQVAVAHKPGWTSRVRHDAGLIYAQSGTFVVVVLTWRGAAPERLAGRVARAAFDRFSRRSRRSAGSPETTSGRPRTSPLPQTRAPARRPRRPSRGERARGRGSAARQAGVRGRGRGTGSRPG
jgi:beta-lactamase class A